ncbi:MAG: hypothetical protein ACRCU5_06785 [Rhizobiaceae bacterium]
MAEPLRVQAAGHADTVWGAERVSIELWSLGLSIAALAISVGTFWYTSVWRGTVKMTQPTLLGIGFGENGSKNQVFVRCMLFSTAKRGVVVENMYARVRRGERAQNFSIWVHGEPREMARGAGLIVGENGITKNFHFLLRNDEPNFEITAGKYEVEIIARVLNKTEEESLATMSVEISQDMVRSGSSSTGFQFDWSPDSKNYVGHISKRDLLAPSPELIMKLLEGVTQEKPTS